MEHIEQVVRRELEHVNWPFAEPVPPGMLARINCELTNAVHREMPILCPTVRIHLNEIALTCDSRVVTVRVEQVQELGTFEVSM